MITDPRNPYHNDDGNADPYPARDDAPYIDPDALDAVLALPTTPPAPCIPTIATIYSWIRPFRATLVANANEHTARIRFNSPGLARNFATYYGSLTSCKYRVSGASVSIPFWVEGTARQPRLV